MSGISLLQGMLLIVLAKHLHKTGAFGYLFVSYYLDENLLVPLQKNVAVLFFLPLPSKVQLVLQ